MLDEWPWQHKGSYCCSSTGTFQLAQGQLAKDRLLPVFTPAKMQFLKMLLNIVGLEKG